MNGEFYNKAFSENEKKLIRHSSISTKVYKSGFLGFGKKEELSKSDDYIFLLSNGEANEYFADDDARKCKATDYAKKDGAGVNSSNGYSYWWLRSPYPDYSNYVCYVSYGGDIDFYNYVSYDCILARPALSINL